MNKKLYRDEYHKVFGGVCSGLADYFEMDVTVVRLLFAFTFFIMGVGFIPYIILWIVLPRKDYTFNNFNNPTVDYTVPPQDPGQTFTTPPPPPPGSFGNRAYTNNPFSNRPYTNTPFKNDPFVNRPLKQHSNAGIIIGMVLIFIGAAILIDEYDLIPDWDFDRLWPLVLVLVGGALIASGQKRHPWDKQDWKTPGKTDDQVIDTPPATENSSTEEPSSL